MVLLKDRFLQLFQINSFTFISNIYFTISMPSLLKGTNNFEIHSF